MRGLKKSRRQSLTVVKDLGQWSFFYNEIRSVVRCRKDSSYGVFETIKNSGDVSKRAIQVSLR